MKGPAHEVPRGPKINRDSLSIPLSPESSDLREELTKVAVLTLEEGFVNESSLLAVIPSLINVSLAGPISPLNDCIFLLPLMNREEVKELCKMGKFKAMTKDGQCVLKIAPWSAEIGAIGRVSGEGRWILIWNLPLHAWC